MTVQSQISGLDGIANETLRALARLEAERLEEIALSCEDLVRDCRFRNSKMRNPASIDCRDLGRDMDALQRLLELTNKNLTFMRSLKSIRGRRLEYGRALVSICPTSEVELGNH